MTLSIFSFQWRWNDYIWPLIVFETTPKKYTFQVAIRSLVGAENVNWTVLIAASVISIIPLVLVFIVFQRLYLRFWCNNWYERLIMNESEKNECLRQTTCQIPNAFMKIDKAREVIIFPMLQRRIMTILLEFCH